MDDPEAQIHKMRPIEAQLLSNLVSDSDNYFLDTSRKPSAKGGEPYSSNPLRIDGPSKRSDSIQDPKSLYLTPKPVSVSDIGFNDNLNCTPISKKKPEAFTLSNTQLGISNLSSIEPTGFDKPKNEEKPIMSLLSPILVALDDSIEKIKENIKCAVLDHLAMGRQDILGVDLVEKMEFWLRECKVEVEIGGQAAPLRSPISWNLSQEKEESITLRVREQIKRDSFVPEPRTPHLKSFFF
jgi:hypothetical protein